MSPGITGPGAPEKNTGMSRSSQGGGGPSGRGAAWATWVALGGGRKAVRANPTWWGVGKDRWNRPMGAWTPAGW